MADNTHHNPEPDPDPDLAPVHYLPHADQTTDRQDTQPEGEVLEGEVLDADEARRLINRTQKELAFDRYRAYRNDVVIAYNATKTVATHRHTQTAAKTAARHALYVPTGAFQVGKRIWEAHSNSRYERLLRQAEAAGDREALMYWEERAETAKDRRHARIMDWIRSPLQLVKALAVGVGTFVALLVGLGIVLAGAHKDISSFLSPFNAVLEFVRWTSIVVTVAWGPLVLAAPWVLLLWLWNEGRTKATLPGWVQTAAPGDLDGTIETTIADALKALRIPHINDHFKQGLPLQYLTPARKDGRGTHAVIRLPRGVTADKIARRRNDLATGLHRLSKEVWPTTGAEAGILELWVADKGALEQGAGDYPLLDDGTVDVFKGVPFGKTLRGEPISAPVMERNTLTGGMPGQGKSSAARVMMAGAALDPSAELRIWVPDANFDFEAFRPRCSRYVMGAEDERIAEILTQLQELHAEVQQRGNLLIKHEQPAVNRKVATTVPGLHPLVCLLEEAHVAIQHPQHGKTIAQLLVDIVRLGRKRGIHLIVSTQAPTKDSMPRDVTRNCSNGIAFAVGDHVANDALLGQGAYAGGHRATELIPGTDKGTAVVKGFSGERSDMVQSYYLDVAREHDQITPLIQRALAAITNAGRSVPGADTSTPQSSEPEDRDLLEDLDQVLGTERVNITDVPALLREIAPNWPAYRDLSGKQLRAELTQLGIKVPSTGNKYRLDPDTVRSELARRATADLDEDDDLDDE